MAMAIEEKDKSVIEQLENYSKRNKESIRDGKE